MPSRGQESAQSPLATAPAASCRLAAESPLPQEPAPISCPLTLSPVINIGDGSAGSRHSSEAGPIPCLHLCTLLPAQQSWPSFWAQRLGGPYPCAGWGGNHAFGRLSMTPALLTQAVWGVPSLMAGCVSPLQSGLTPQSFPPITQPQPSLRIEQSPRDISQTLPNKLQ